MEHFLLLVILAGGIHASWIVPSSAAPETKCSLLTVGPCSPEVGGTVYIKLMANATGYMLVFSKEIPSGYLKVLIVKGGKVKIRKEYRNRTEFSIDTGTLKMSNLMRNDTGQYSLDVYTPRGALVQMISFPLTVRGKKIPSNRGLLYVEVGVPLIVLLGCLLILTLKPWRRPDYQTLT